MPRTELDAFSRLYLNHGLLSTWDGAISMLAGSAVGGGTLINWMTCIDAPRSVRAEWATRARARRRSTGRNGTPTGPIVEHELGVTETATFPPKDDVIRRGAAALGWEAAPIHRNARSCADCGRARSAARAARSRWALRVHLAAGGRRGARGSSTGRGSRDSSSRADGSPASRPTSSSRTRRRGCRCCRCPAGSAWARRFAGSSSARRRSCSRPGALRSPAILQCSAGVSIGRSAGTCASTRCPSSPGAWPSPWTCGAARCRRRARWSSPGRRSRRDGYVIESAPGHPGLLALAVPWDGAADHARWLAASRYLSPLVAVTRDGGEGRDSPDEGGPGPRSTIASTAIGVRTLRHAAVSMARMVRAAGAPSRSSPPATPILRHADRGAGRGARGSMPSSARLAALDFWPNRGTVFSAHQMGTIRMGADRRDHAADPRGRVRDADGRRHPGSLRGRHLDVPDRARGQSRCWPS